MRLLLRANSHRPLAAAAAGSDDAPGAGYGGYEVAASPDTPTRPDRWSWHIRVLEPSLVHADASASSPVLGAPAAGGAGADASAAFVEELVELGAGAVYRVLEVGYDPQAVRPDIALVETGEGRRLTREERDLTVLLVVAGQVRVEHRHDLAPGDVLILAGDDPLAVDLSPGHGADPGEHPRLAVVTLRAPGGAGVPWVP